ncbi:MAG: PAS domain S-box protein [Thermodesulfobacteriota bacterium]
MTRRIEGDQTLRVPARKQPRKALKKAEERYRRIFEDSKDMVYMISADGRHTEVNQAGVDLLGYESKKEMMQVYAKERKDGTPIDVLITANARRDDAGKIIGYDGIIKDISDRKRVEEELGQRTRELETLNEMGALINQTLVDLDTVLPIALEKAVRLTGYEDGSIYLANDEEQILERKYHFSPPAAMPETTNVIKYGEGVSGKAFILKQPVVNSIDEYLSYRKAPALIKQGIQTLVGFPLLSKGKAIGTITLFSRSRRELSQRDIHLLESIGSQIGLALENARLFSNVAKAKLELETTFDAVTDLLTIRDKDYRIIRANKAAFKRFRLKPEDLGKKRCFEIFYHRDQPCEGCYLSQTVISKKPTIGEKESRYLDGIFQYYAFPIFDETQEVVGIVNLLREITDEKRLEMEKEIVNNVNKILASSLDMKELIKAVHSELKKVLDSERMSIALFNEDGKGFRFFALERDYDAEILVGDEFYPRKGTHFERVVETGLPEIIDNAESDSWASKKLLAEGIRSSLLFPLEYKGKVIGTMNFGSKKANHFSEAQFNLLRQIAPGLAISIQNALLFEKIKQSEEEYRTVVESALDGVCVISTDYRFKYVNEKLAEIQGYSREELIWTDVRDYLDEESKAMLEDRDDRRKRGIKLSPHFELNILRKDGKTRSAEISARSIKDSKGNINIIVILKDITERKRAEEELNISRMHLVDAMDMARIAYWEFDRETMQFIFNDAFYALCGTTVEAEGGYRMMMKDYYQRFVHPDDLAIVHQSAEESLQAPGPEFINQLEHRVIRRDGEIRYFLVRSRTLKDASGNPIRGYGANQDITERKQAEEALKKNQEELIKKNKEIDESRRNLQLAIEELEQAYKELKASQAKILRQEKMASIGQLAAGVAHEINNPMAFISSNLGTLDKYVGRLTEFIQTQTEVIESLHATDAIEGLNRKQKELKLDYITEDIKGLISESLDGSERVQKIVQGLKNFARVDEAEYKYADMNECIESTINVVWNELKYKATLKKDYGNLPLTKCYPQQMNQVFMNLLINAGDAIEKQGEILIKTWDEDGSIWVGISDTGRGILKEDLNRIFEPFFTTKEVGKGTGLGLSITYEIVKNHHGEIGVESEVGKGTTFTVRIPIV